MTDPFWQILAYPLLAFLLGLLLGWWLGSRKLHDRLERLEKKWRLKYQGRRERLEACREELEAGVEERDLRRKELEACQADLASCRKEVETAREVSSACDDPAAAPARLLEAEEVAEDRPQGEGQTVAPEPDDLKKVEGIGPKIEDLLNAKGIDTWSQLAAADVSFLRSVLDKAGPRFRLHNPSTWPRQAALAADGAWDELKELRSRLKGGRES